MKRTEAFNHARAAARAADDKLGENILAIDVRGQSSLADCFLFVSGTSHIHIRAIEDAVREALKDSGAELRRTDGQRGHLWRALDYGSLIVHVMDQRTRDFYSIERLWDQGKQIEWEKPAPKTKTKVQKPQKPKAKKKTTRRK